MSPLFVHNHSFGCWMVLLPLLLLLLLLPGGKLTKVLRLFEGRVEAEHDVEGLEKNAEMKNQNALFSKKRPWGESFQLLPILCC